MDEERDQPARIGLFLNPSGQRRVDFQHACGGLFERLFLADGSEQAGYLLAQQAIDLLVIDLTRFERALDLASLGELIALRAGAPVLLMCPFHAASWLPELMAYGPLSYRIAPLVDAELNDAVVACLQRPCALAADASTLRALLGMRSRLQHAVAAVDDNAPMAEQIVAALCHWPCVVHAALLRLGENDKLQLEAQHGTGGMTLAGLVNGSDHLSASPLRHAFPGLLAACSGELAYLDAPHKAGEPEMALALHDKGVEMVIGVPIPALGPGGPQGALCLMFERHALLTHEELATLNDLAHLAGFGLRMADMGREGEQMLARLTYLAITDALTGVANRRRGEEVLELEIRRARRYKLPLAVIAFDVDHFKAINDRYGHAVGDVALCTVATAARDALRSSDALARSGGEEFFIVASHTSAIDGLKLAEKLRLAIAETEVPGCDRLTISLGVAQLAEQETGDALTVRVMAALARAKRAGRNCVELAMS